LVESIENQQLILSKPFVTEYPYQLSTDHREDTEKVLHVCKFHSFTQQILVSPYSNESNIIKYLHAYLQFKDEMQNKILMEYFSDKQTTSHLPCFLTPVTYL
jgi:hypothetical protein